MIFFCAISAKSPLFDELPISTNEPSLEPATMPCSSEELTIAASPLVSIATPAGWTPNCEIHIQPYFW